MQRLAQPIIEAGFICPLCTPTPVPSPRGFYQPNTGISDIQALYVCPPGFYCPNEGMTNYKGFICEKGHYCPAGSTSATQVECPAGSLND